MNEEGQDTEVGRDTETVGVEGGPSKQDTELKEGRRIDCRRPN